ncbi:peptidoglycan-binding protein [Streptacidiphilus sp. P02-A3a]|uniref:peptidoglycan-binding domain-containing protein n=1 Tax=Streptacidiphilus sp. P02-A3a TaxID=2704468 RepID=UPI0015FAE594|nr:peptidoglycan-binding domain-containing protein [Streptacidiphilus sp. P02-A3a]QMU68312.1 peptidoglycan-binding protein [Streptacidiphilus sp. P02-A3a]
MTGQLCGRCGNALAPEGCPCGWSGSNEETAVIPVVGGPELVRPYFHPDGDDPEQVFDAEIVDAELLDPVDGSRQPRTQQPVPAPQAQAQQTAVLPAYLPAQRSAEPLGSVVVTRPPAGPRTGRGRRAPGRSRSTLLIAAGITVIAAVGVAAALVPQLLGGGPVKVALPQPGVTAPLPTQAAPSAVPSSAATATAAPTASATRLAPVVRHSPSPSGSAPAAPVQVSTRPTPSRSVGAPATSAPPSPSPSASPSATGGGSSGTLALGSSGPAVVTLQQELNSIWGLDATLNVDGVYGEQTKKVVAKFQRWFIPFGAGDPTGVYGPYTQAAMAQQLAIQNGGQ